jgi:glycosyltransferase involved in cell wall biosynthesis
MKILVMNWRDITNPRAGGAEVHINEVAKRWVKWGHEVTLFCGKYEGCKEADNIEGVEIIRKGDAYTVYLHAMKEFLWNLKNKGYDILIDDINGVPFFTPMYANIPKTAIMHHLVKDIFFKELPLQMALIGYIAESLIHLIYRNTPFIAVSESTKENLVKFGISKRNINVIHNGVDLGGRRIIKKQKSPSPHVVYIGRIKPYKNLNNLLHAIHMVINSKQLANVKLTIAGRGDYKELKNTVNNLNLNRQVELLGEINEDEKVQLYNRAWVYVATSSGEGWGLTVIEANACGTPVIAYNSPGLKDSINEKTGLLVAPYGKIENLSNAIIRVLIDEEFREKLSRNSIKWARRFSWDQTATRTAQVLKNNIHRDN